MPLHQRLELRQGQSLVMTPQLQQAIKLLQFSNLELAEFVDAELERNPLLVREDPESDGGRSHDGQDGDNANRTEDGANATSEFGELSISDAGPSTGAESALDADYESLNPESTREELSSPDPLSAAQSRISTPSSTGSSDFAPIDSTPAAKNLKHHLAEQLAMAPCTPAMRLIGSALIELVDDDGYLRAETDDIAKRLGAAPGLVDQMVTVMQGFEPAGIMARDLKECLALQLKDRNRFDPAIEALVNNLELLARHDLKSLRQLCGVDDEDMADMIAELRALTPKPGLSFGGEPTVAVSPDVFVRQTENGAWAVELNTDTLPRVLLDSKYYAEVNAGVRTANEREFITECHQTASWLVRSLAQRAQTILKVASEIVRQQDGFLAEGISKLRPLNLKTIADAIDMHESTVSRVTSNKFMATPRGVFELKYFFTAAIPARDGGEAHSAESVRHMIKSMIDKEEPNSVLSDDRIVELLEDLGVDIARRTVAKYREAMNIPSSVQRRRMLRRAS